MIYLCFIEFKLKQNAASLPQLMQLSNGTHIPLDRQTKFLGIHINEYWLRPVRVI